MIAGSFRVSLFIECGGADNLEKRSGYFMIIRWPINCFVYQWRNLDLRASMRTSNIVTSSFSTITQMPLADTSDIIYSLKTFAIGL